MNERERNEQINELRLRGDGILNDVGMALVKARRIYEFDVGTRHRAQGYFFLKPDRFTEQSRGGGFVLDVEVSPTMSTPDEMVVGTRVLNKGLMRQAWSLDGARRLHSSAEELAGVGRRGTPNLIGMHALGWSAEELAEFMLY